MKRSFHTLFALTLVFLLVTGTVGAQSGPDKTGDLAPDQAQVSQPVARYSIPRLYIVRLQDAPLAGYEGGLPGLDATSPEATGQTRLDVDSPASLAYRSYLADKQAQAIAGVNKTLGRDVEVAFRYDVAYNGLAVRVTAEEAQALAGLPGIAGVQPDFRRYPTTDAGPQWLGAPGIWDGSATGGLPGTKGEGLIVGIVDTGINFDHPSFADLGGDGYDHTNPFGAGVYKGFCNPSHPKYNPTIHKCNDKLVGAWDFTDKPSLGEDDEGHGSHTASTTAGNVTVATITAPTTVVVRDISGVAPHANIIAYDACIAGEGCPGTALIAAIDQAVADGVDVINYSIGGGASDPWGDADSEAFLNARAAGIFVATSAGNDGPGAATMGSPANAPWLLSVGASTHDRKFVNSLTAMSSSEGPLADIQGASITSGYGPAPIVHAKNYDAFAPGDPDDGQCLTPFPAGTWTNGEIVVCDRGEIARVDKGANAKAGGAGGFVLSNTAAESEGLSADAHELPAVHIGYAAAQVLEAWLDSGTGHVATISGTSLDIDPANGDIMADFSSRGPNPPLPGIIKPDVVAPGVAIIAASKDGEEFASMGGTSMASPHAAGSATLVKAVHPDWSDAEIQSALMLTSLPDNMLKEDKVTPADPFDMGAGRIDLGQAARAGLVLNETIANYQAANPDTGGDPRQLNIASLADGDCQGTCSWTRTFRNTLVEDTTWTTAVVGAPPGLMVTVTPASFRAQAGGSRTLEITADVSHFNATLHGQDGWGFAWLELSSPGQETLHLPIAVKKPSSSAPLMLHKEVSQAEVEVGEVVTFTIEIVNRDNVTNTYTLVDSLPPGLEYVDGSASGGLVYNPATRQLTWSGDVGPGAIDYVVTPVTHIPYINLGAVPYSKPGICASYFPTDCDDKVLRWSLGGETYTFYGETLDEINQSSNSMIFGPEGWLGSACSACNQRLPQEEEINQVIAGLWRDTRPGLGGKGELYGLLLTGLLENADDTVFYGNWHDVGQYGALTITSRHAIAIVLDGQSEPAGRIYYIYDNITGNLTTNGFTVGVENKYGDRGTTQAYAPCNGGACIPQPAVGSPPADGTTLRLDPVISGENYHRTFTYQVQITSQLQAMLANRAEVSSNSPTAEAQSMWALAEVTVHGPTLSITKDVDTLLQAAGQVVTYTLTFGNEGDRAANGVVVSDTLPPQVEYAWSNPPGTYDGVEHELVWTGLDLALGDLFSATVAVTIGLDVPTGTQIVNTAYLLYQDVEPLTAQVSHYATSSDYIIFLPLILRDH